MKQTKMIFTTLLFAICSLQALSQETELLDVLPSTKEEFIASEKKVLATIDWLESTPINKEEDKRTQQKALLVAWITNSPTVTLEINASILDFTKKNPDLLIIFMAGWTRYALQNNYSKDVFPGSVAGIKSAIKVYKTGLLKKDKEMEKLAEKAAKGELEEWVKSELSK